MSRKKQSLAQKFVNSAVKQVGRDGGKVISNKVYGDKHASPIRVDKSSQPGSINAQQPKQGSLLSTLFKYWIICMGVGLVLYFLGVGN